MRVELFFGAEADARPVCACVRGTLDRPWKVNDSLCSGDDDDFARQVGDVVHRVAGHGRVRLWIRDALHTRKEDWVGWVSRRMMRVMINCPGMGQTCPVPVKFITIVKDCYTTSDAREAGLMLSMGAVSFSEGWRCGKSGPKWQVGHASEPRSGNRKHEHGRSRSALPCFCKVFTQWI